MDQPKIERLLRLMMLLTGNRIYSVLELAKSLQTTNRTIYRYIDTLKEAGFLFIRDNGGVKLNKESPYFKDISQLIHFTKEEAYILKSAIENIDETNLLKQNLKRKLYSVYDYKMLANTVVKGKNSAIVNHLVEAIESNQQVMLRNYSSPNSKNVSNRLIEPFAFTTNYIQVWAYEPTKQQNKLFNLSRIEQVDVLNQSWQYLSQHKEGFIDVFRISSFQLFTIKLRLGLLSANLLTEEYPLAEQYLTKICDNEWIFETEVCSYEGVGRFVIGLLHDIEILNCPDFKEFVRKRIDSFKI